MRYGHSPKEIDQYDWADIMNFMNALPAILEKEGPMMGGNG